MALKNIFILKQGHALVDRVDDETYARPVEGISRAGIGGHIRHCLDFYECFLEGRETGRVDYNQRRRDESVELNRLVAIDRMESTIRSLGSLAGDADPRLLEVKADEAREPGEWSISSVSRELKFLFGHTIHHYAVIAILLRLQGIDPGDDFGVAPSTLDYWAGRAV